MRVTDQSEIQRYSTEMLNVIAAGLDKTWPMPPTPRRAATARLDVQSGADDTGLPMLVVRGPFTLVWQRLPAALEKVGMKVTDRTRPQGTVAVTYKSLSSSDWDALGVKDPELAAGDYKLQVGDLDNRSSLQFIDPKGHTADPVAKRCAGRGIPGSIQQNQR